MIDFFKEDGLLIMNAKKFLKQQAEQDRQEILAESGEENLRALEEKIQPTAKKRARLRKWLPTAASAVAATAVLVTCLAVFRPWQGVQAPDDSVQTPADDENRYGNGGEYAFSNLEEVNAGLKEFCFINSPAYPCTAMRAYDLDSGNTQFYTLSYASTELPIEITFVALKSDDYDEQFWNETIPATTVTLPGYTVTYYTWEKHLAQYGETVLHAQAKIVKGNETVFVTEYSETTDDPEGSFLEVVRSILQ